jgi:hypothetical protein
VRCDDYRMALDYWKAFNAIAKNGAGVQSWAFLMFITSAQPISLSLESSPNLLGLQSLSLLKWCQRNPIT